MTRARLAPATPFLLVLLMALVEFGQVWYYPGGERGVEVTRAFGGAFRMLLWILALLAILVHLARRGPVPALRTLWPFAPFILWGAVAVCFWSVDRVTGLRALTFWSLGAGVAVAAGHELEPRTLARAGAALFGAVVAASLLLAALRPEAAHTLYGDTLAVRGLFPHKNQLGWYCAIGLLWSGTLRHSIGPPLLVAVVPVLLAGLLIADSTTALAIAVAGSGFGFAVRLSARMFADGARAALALAMATAVALALAAATAPSLLGALGRDSTFTGRTEVWRHYFAQVQDRSLTGFGTGVFSTTTRMNIEIGGSVPGYERENLHSPHSLYLGIAGETGVVGVLCFLFAQLHLAFVAPYRRLSPWLRLSATLAFAILLAGLAEMRDGYAPGAATVALLAARSAGLRSAGARPVTPAARRATNPIAQAL
jgi:exopolysaccharide production protein ExoQ